MKIVVIGGGIGGLSAAITLGQVGHDVEIHEKSNALTEIGAGLQISPNGMRVLDALGLTELIEGQIFEPHSIQFRNGRTGKIVFDLRMRGFASTEWGARYVHISRSDLQSALIKRVDELENVKLVLGSEPEKAIENGGFYEIKKSTGETLNADLFVAADGVHSTFRNQVSSSDGPQFTGQVAWRFTAPIDNIEAPPPPSSVIWAGSGQHAVTTRINAGSTVNFVALVETENWQSDGWHQKGDVSVLRRQFDGWHETIAQTIDAATDVGTWGLLAHPELERWHHKNLVLLGDAAHPMLPSMAQGACQAMEDAVVLANCVSKPLQMSESLSRYAVLRKARTTRIQRRSATNAKVFHRRTAVTRFATQAPLKIVSSFAPEIIHKAHDWIYSYDATRIC